MPDFIVEEGDYRLAADSPCIDIAPCSDPPGTDLQGVARPQGAGCDMGAYEHVVLRSELLARDVVVPSAAAIGDTIPVEYRITNGGTGGTPSRWFVALALSTDDRWDPSDRIVARLRKEGVVPPGESVELSDRVTLPVVDEGVYHLLVIPVSGVRASSGSIDIGWEAPELMPGGEALSSSLDTGRLDRYFRITPAAGTDLRVVLDATEDQGLVELYIRRGELPTRWEFDARHSGFVSPRPRLLLTNAAADTYYILAHAALLPRGRADFAIRADYPTPEIESLDPERCASGGDAPVSITVRGAALPAGSTLALRRETAVVEATDVVYEDTSAIRGLFDLSGLAAGAWTLEVDPPDAEPVTAPFFVEEAGAALFEAEIFGPTVIGYARAAVFQIRYANLGDVPMTAPRLRLESSPACLLTVDPDLAGPALLTDDPPEGLSAVLEVDASGSGHAGILNPGEVGYIRVYYRGVRLPWPPVAQTVSLTLRLVTPGEPVLLQLLPLDAVFSIDPNEKTGPAGFGEERYARQPDWIQYTIHFENQEEATAAAMEVRIEDDLADVFDWTTFEFVGAGVGAARFVPPPGLLSWSTREETPRWTHSVDEGWHVDALPLGLDVQGELDLATGRLTFGFLATDPETGTWPEDPYSGFLPPADPSLTGFPARGFVSYRIRLLDGLESGTLVPNEARIIFDYNEAIQTNLVSNILDLEAPTSAVTALPDTVAGADFEVSWSGLDGEGSGISTFAIHVSIDGGPFELWIETEETSATYEGELGRCYEFCSTATDHVGHVEAKSPSAEARTCTAGTLFRRADSNADGGVDLSDAVFILGYLFLGAAPPTCADAADTNDSGALDLSDAVYPLSHLFLGGPAPPAPFEACGRDGTDDALECASHAACAAR